MSAVPDVLDRLLEPVGRALSTEAAQRLVELRADPETQRRIDELADRCNEGLLTDEERGEYSTLIQVGSLIAVLQAKARRILAEKRPVA